MLLPEQTFDGRDAWRLLAEELSLLPGMTDTGRLGFAIQLKFRQVQGHYPESLNDFPSGVVHAIAGQIGCTSVSLENYPLQGRQAQRTTRIFVAIWGSDSPIKLISHDSAPG